MPCLLPIAFRQKAVVVVSTAGIPPDGNLEVSIYLDSHLGSVCEVHEADAPSLFHVLCMVVYVVSLQNLHGRVQGKRDNTLIIWDRED